MYIYIYSYIIYHCKQTSNQLEIHNPSNILHLPCLHIQLSPSILGPGSLQLELYHDRVHNVRINRDIVSHNIHLWFCINSLHLMCRSLLLGESRLCSHLHRNLDLYMFGNTSGILYIFIFIFIFIYICMYIYIYIFIYICMYIYIITGMEIDYETYFCIVECWSNANSIVLCIYLARTYFSDGSIK